MGGLSAGRLAAACWAVAIGVVAAATSVQAIRRCKLRFEGWLTAGAPLGNLLLSRPSLAHDSATTPAWPTGAENQARLDEKAAATDNSRFSTARILPGRDPRLVVR
jgi:hypothetical protein